jgi:hypothetical protein
LPPCIRFVSHSTAFAGASERVHAIKGVEGERPRDFAKTKAWGKNISPDALEAAEAVQTIKEYQALQRKWEQAEKRTFTMKTHKGYESQNKRADALRAALDLVEARGTWQFIPSGNLLMIPSNVLELASTKYDEHEHTKIKESVPEAEVWGFWQRSRIYDDPPEHHNLDEIKKFRAIVESDISREEKINQINELVWNSRDELLLWQFRHEELQPGHEWYASELERAGLPLAYQLYREGYTTLTRCLEIDPKEFLKRKGVGPVTVKKLKEFQERTKKVTELQDQIGDTELGKLDDSCP